jgi:hypothetical protein
MSHWPDALILAFAVVTLPFLMLFAVLAKLPRPNALAHRPWPMAVNYIVIGLVTGYVTMFIHNTYYVRGTTPLAVFAMFLIAAVAYGFGVMLIVRQRVGVYPEFLVTTGVAGLGMRKIAYRNIEDVEEVWRGHGETRLRIHTTAGTTFQLVLPTRSVSVLHERLQASQPPE